MPRRVDVTLSEEDREVLERWARRPKSAQALALRCRIVLAAAEGRQSDDGHGNLPIGGHRISPLADAQPPHGRPSLLPTH
jgi:hypothetical protein